MSAEADYIRATLARHAGDIGRYKVASLRLFGEGERDMFIEDHELGMIVEFDYDRRPTLFDQVGLENYLSDLLRRPVHVISAGGMEPAYRAHSLGKSVRVL